MIAFVFANDTIPIIDEQTCVPQECGIIVDSRIDVPLKSKIQVEYQILAGSSTDLNSACGVVSSGWYAIVC